MVSFKKFKIMSSTTTLKQCLSFEPSFDPFKAKCVEKFREGAIFTRQEKRDSHVPPLKTGNTSPLHPQLATEPTRVANMHYTYILLHLSIGTYIHRHRSLQHSTLKQGSLCSCFHTLSTHCPSLLLLNHYSVYSLLFSKLKGLS